MSEWSKEAVLKTAERKLRGFESLSLRQKTPRPAPRGPVGPAAPSGSPRLPDGGRHALADPTSAAHCHAHALRQFLDPPAQEQVWVVPVVDAVELAPIGLAAD